jgi:hypothetical protein
MANAKIRDYANRRAPSGPKFKRAATQGKSLGGVATETGSGTKITNTMFQAGISTKGMKEAMAPKGPSGK